MCARKESSDAAASSAACSTLPKRRTGLRPDVSQRSRSSLRNTSTAPWSQLERRLYAISNRGFKANGNEGRTLNVRMGFIGIVSAGWFLFGSSGYTSAHRTLLAGADLRLWLVPQSVSSKGHVCARIGSCFPENRPRSRLQRWQAARASQDPWHRACGERIVGFVNQRSIASTALAHKSPEDTEITFRLGTRGANAAKGKSSDCVKAARKVTFLGTGGIPATTSLSGRPSRW